MKELVSVEFIKAAVAALVAAGTALEPVRRRMVATGQEADGSRPPHPPQMHRSGRISGGRAIV